MALWRTDTHWYRPIRLTDKARFAEDMRRGWVAAGALEPTLDDVCRDAYAGIIRDMLVPQSLLDRFMGPAVTLTGGPIVYPIRTDLDTAFRTDYAGDIRACRLLPVRR